MGPKFNLIFKLDSYLKSNLSKFKHDFLSNHITQIKMRPSIRYINLVFKTIYSALTCPKKVGPDV